MAQEGVARPRALGRHIPPPSTQYLVLGKLSSVKPHLLGYCPHLYDTSSSPSSQRLCECHLLQEVLPDFPGEGGESNPPLETTEAVSSSFRFQ